MKTDIFLIYRYWKAHKNQLFRMLISIVILTVLLLVSILMVRTECRRTFEEYLYGKGASTYMYLDLSEEAYADMQTDELYESGGQVAIYGKMGNDANQYTCGAYLDENAADLEYLKLTAGRFPESAGEAAVYDYVIEDNYFTSDAESYLGVEITLQTYDFQEGSNWTGEQTGEETVKIVGIIETDDLRETKEYGSIWDVSYTQISMPIIYIYPEENTTPSYVYTMIKLKGDDILTEEKASQLEDFMMSYYDTYGAAPHTSVGYRTAAESVANYSVGSETTQTQIYTNDTMTVLQYFSVIAILISAISLFGIMFPVMESRMKSIHLLRTIGYSKRQVLRQLFLEWIWLLCSGLILGIVLGCGIYELILFVQNKWLGLSALHSYTAEWAVLQVTKNPFVVAILCTVCTFAIGYLLYFLRVRFFSKQRLHRRKKVRSFRKIQSTLSGRPFVKSMQVITLALVLATTSMCYSYYTISGKGDGYFTDDNFKGDLYYSYGGIQMNDNNVDICLYNTIQNTTGLAVLGDNGIPADTLDSISSIDGVETVWSVVLHNSFNAYYEKDDPDAPNEIRTYYAELAENADEELHPDERDYYQILARFGNDEVMEHLAQYVQEGEIGQYENGLTVVYYEKNGGMLSAYSIGDTVQTCVGTDSSDYATPVYHESEEVIEAIAVIPESAAEDEPMLYTIFDTGNTITFAAPQETAVTFGTYKENYDYTYITLADGVSESDVLPEIQALLDSSMQVKLQTLSACHADFRAYMIAQYASIFFVFFILILMSITGYYSLISMRLQSSQKNTAILRTFGMSEQAQRRNFFWHMIENTIGSIVLGSGIVYLLRWLLRTKYQAALDVFGYPDGDLLGADETVYAQVNQLEHTYLLNHEIFNAPVWKAILVSALALLVLSVIVTILIQHTKKAPILEQIADQTKE